MLKSYEIINHGIENSSYFQGCGTSYTRFTHCFTGIGDDAKEAYEDAIELAYQGGDVASADLEKLPRRPRGINKKMRVPASYEDCYVYVSIRLEVK